MDQGLAAVLGAAVGIVGTLGTGTLGYLAARRQASDQGCIDHAHQLRADRREAYLALLQALKPVHEIVNVVVEELRERGIEYEPNWEELGRVADLASSAEKSVAAAAQTVELYGPFEASNSAACISSTFEELEALIGKVVLRADSADLRRISPVLNQLARHRVEFIAAGRTVLESVPD
ncbi:hypothetical protein [Streptomyces phaeochromogenes]